MNWNLSCVHHSMLIVWNAPPKGSSSNGVLQNCVVSSPSGSFHLFYDKFISFFYACNVYEDYV